MKRFIYCILIMLLVQCREKFTIPLDQPAQGYLVVEGFINPIGSSTIKLSGSGTLSERNIVPTTQAIVQIIGEDNSVYPVNEQSSGVYVSDTLNLNPAIRYKINIKTQENKVYESTYTAVKNTPVIDQLTYIYSDNGVEIYVNSHDPQNNTRYYQWDYDETWEFNSAFRANLTFTTVTGPDALPIASLDFFFPSQTANESIFTCWQSSASSSILIGSTVKLAQDVVYIPIATYPKGAWQLSKLYSIHVKQHAISREQFEFLSKMKKNSENLGTLFDAQPSELIGNISCISNPGEPVIGNIDVSNQTEKRLFISNDDLPGWNYESDCSQQEILNQADSIQYAYVRFLLPTTPAKLSMAGNIETFWASPNTCVDCTLRGTNIKPSFWP